MAADFAELDTIRVIPGDRISFVQLADAPLVEMDLLYRSRHFRNMPGEGDLDVQGFMGAVAATGDDGFHSPRGPEPVDCTCFIRC